MRNEHNTHLITTNSVPVVWKQLSQEPGLHPARIRYIDGYFVTDVTTGTWLQFHDSSGEPGVGNVPVYELFLGTALKNGFAWQYNDEGLELPELSFGLAVAISTAQGVFATNSNTKVNLYMTFINPEFNK